MKSVCALGALAALVVGSSAPAAMIGPVFKVQATSDLGTAEFVVTAPAETSRGSSLFNWSLDAPVQLTNDVGDVIATLSFGSASATSRSSPRGVGPTLALNFSVSAGGSPTIFTISSPTLSFPAIDPAFATASAAMTATDNNGDGVSITGGHDGGGAFRADYNGLVPTGTLFSELLGDFGAGPFQSNSQSDTSGPFAPVGEGVSSMSTQFRFAVGALDGVSGTSVFVVSPVVPTPGAAVLALTAGLVIRRRRRR